MGNEHEGNLEATTLDDARQQLRQDGFQVLKLEEEDEASLFPRRIGKDKIIYATSQLAIMVETGITLSVALDGILEQEDNPTFKAVLKDLKMAVEGGEDFSTALERHPKHFDHTYVSLVRASEATGTLGEMLERIAGYLRKELETRGKVRTAMAYPTVMAVVAIGVTTFLLVFVLPKFAPLFAKKGLKLPTVTVYMMAASRFLIDYWYLCVLGVVGSVVGFVFGKRTQPGRKIWDWLKISLPIVGPMFRKVTISRSIRTLGTMIGSGVSVLDAIQLSADVSGNYYYEQLWHKVLEQITSGHQIHEALSSSPLFPNMLVQMIRSGEETGKLDLILEKISGFYDLEVEQSLKTTTSMIEPIMITVMGFIVGGIGLGLLLPIFSLGRTPG
jgi:type IV pilus assembly protein PilC